MIRSRFKSPQQIEIENFRVKDSRDIIGCEGNWKKRGSKVKVKAYVAQRNESRKEATYKEIYESRVRYVELETIWGHPN